MTKTRKTATLYSIEIATEICRAIATNACGVGILCERNPHWPARQTINEWRYDHPEFHDMYYDARKHQIDLLAEEMIDIADEKTNDTIIRQGHDGKEKEYMNTEWINRSRLRVDARKWMAMKLLPKIYGEKSEQKIEVSTHENWLETLK
jgi:hypothetical protein